MSFTPEYGAREGHREIILFLPFTFFPDEEAYLLELVRYIHLKPLRDKIATNLKELVKYPSHLLSYSAGLPFSASAFMPIMIRNPVVARAIANRNSVFQCWGRIFC